MYDYISGKVAELTPTKVIIDNQGIGYEIEITLLDYSELRSADYAKMYIHESIREDAHVMYGFLQPIERETFRLLIGVSGVGPNTARLILSAMTTDQFNHAVSSSDTRALKGVKGIGARTAERIIVDLKDKIKTTDLTLSKGMGATSEVYEDSLAALQMLGFTSQQSQKALKKVFDAEPDITTERAIKQALKLM